MLSLTGFMSMPRVTPEVAKLSGFVVIPEDCWCRRFFKYCDGVYL
jgi:hypothetical protein